MFQFGDKVVFRACAVDLATVLCVDGERVEVLWCRPYSIDVKEWVAADRLMLAANYHLLDAEVAFAEVQSHKVTELRERSAWRRMAFQLREKATDMRSREEERAGMPRCCETIAKFRMSTNGSHR